MMLGVTRSIGDFYHQTWGVTWEPEVIVKQLGADLGSSPYGVLCLASDGVWDHWRFEDAMEALCVGGTPPDERRVYNFCETTRRKGYEAFGDGADNLTSVVVVLPNPDM